MAQRSRDPETRYREHIRHEQKILEEYAAGEIGYADNLLRWHRAHNREIPDDEYRAAAYFKNREWLRKRGTLAILYAEYRQCMKELPPVIAEIKFDVAAHRFKRYARILEEGGY